ncbi:hypothetical protein TNCV_151421 [Trichonephila clavipes]|uniref:Uncharacterized protein n=1 Tax=Trichonephila clavipes TaxID=2585209 RepID=A0A8X6RKQ0_TRICX|nr:hypothetical protein TNCV_151421 [Trichonephila clavipes]
MRWGGSMDMVDAWSPVESRFSRSRICSICVSLSPNRGASPFCSTICLVHLITSDWSGTSAELPHKVHCLLEARENLMTHPKIYESNDPPGVGMFGTPSLRNSTPQ